MLRIAAALLALLAFPVQAQFGVGQITAYTYTQFGSEQCWIEPTAGQVTVKVFCELADDLGGVRFRLIPDPGLHFEYVGEEVPMTVGVISGFTGNSQAGLQIDGAWGGRSTHLLTVTYTATATPDPCARLRFLAYPGSLAETAEVFGANGVEEWVVPGVHELKAQPCDVAWCVLGVPVTPTTWGAIKAMYR